MTTPPVKVSVDLTKLFENVGKVGGATLVTGMASVVLGVSGLALAASNPLILALSLTPAVVVLPISFWHFARRANDGRVDGGPPKLTGPPKLPREITRYLELFPRLGSEADLVGGYVRTSAESFMYLSRSIFDELRPGSDISATDRLILSEVREEYWHHGGLAYLENNFRAVGRGITVKRYFIIPTADIASHARLLRCVLDINAMCGVKVHVVRYEDLKPHQRREFAIFGPRFCDDVTYDIFGRGIIENRVYFSPEKHAELSELVRSIAHLATPFVSDIARATTFDDVLDFARRVRAELANEGPNLLQATSPLLLKGEVPG